jgi:hypothetical protein
MAMLLGATVAVAIGTSIPSGIDGRVVTSVTDAQRLENSSAAIREIGATLSVEMPGNPATCTPGAARGVCRLVRRDPGVDRFGPRARCRHPVP